MVQSMTGFAALSGENEVASWSVEIRGVNAKGLDIRLRAPERLVPLEPKIKDVITEKISRGNIYLGIKVETNSASKTIDLDVTVLDAYLDVLGKIKARAEHSGLDVAPATHADILALRGILRSDEDAKIDLPTEEILATIRQARDEFVAMREKEGTALGQVLLDQTCQVEALVNAASELLEDRKDQVAQSMKQSLQRVMNNADSFDEQRLVQELALIAVKSDVTEEIDRLRAHIAAAKSLLKHDGPIGRKFDFLLQEFNREANTLCSKSQNTDLTQCGLDLKAVIDQMREHVKNVE